MKPWLFISDLHLSPERPDMIALFCRFCTEVASQAERLYILGDLLEYWVGDDDPGPGLETAFDALHALQQQGVAIYFMAGNRDFLVGDRLADRCGMQRLADPTVVDFRGTALLLMHGDSLCVDDEDYQQFRRMVRDPAWQQAFLDKPLQERQAVARQVREHSQQATALKDAFIMDVNADSVARVMNQYQVQYLIHGHTHRPAIHRAAGDESVRIVLADWYEQGSYLSLQSLEQLELTPFVSSSD